MPVFGVKEWKNHRVQSLGAICKILRDYQNCHIGVWKLLIEKLTDSWSCIWALFLHQGVDIQLIFVLWSADFEIEILYVVISLIRLMQIMSKGCTYTLFQTPGSQFCVGFHSTCRSWVWYWKIKFCCTPRHHRFHDFFWLFGLLDDSIKTLPLSKSVRPIFFLGN